jgi:hypothetical protein
VRGPPHEIFLNGPSERPVRGRRSCHSACPRPPLPCLTTTHRRVAPGVSHPALGRRQHGDRSTAAACRSGRRVERCGPERSTPPSRPAPRGTATRRCAPRSSTSCPRPRSPTGSATPPPACTRWPPCSAAGCPGPLGRRDRRRAGSGCGVPVPPSIAYPPQMWGALARRSRWMRMSACAVPPTSVRLGFVRPFHRLTLEPSPSGVPRLRREREYQSLRSLWAPRAARVSLSLLLLRWQACRFCISGAPGSMSARTRSR